MSRTWLETEASRRALQLNASLGLLRKKRLLAETPAKLNALQELSKVIGNSAGTILFSETIRSTNSAADLLIRKKIEVRRSTAK